MQVTQAFDLSRVKAGGLCRKDLLFNSKKSDSRIYLYEFSKLIKIFKKLLLSKSKVSEHLDIVGSRNLLLTGQLSYWKTWTFSILSSSCHFELQKICRSGCSLELMRFVLNYLLNELQLLHVGFSNRWKVKCGNINAECERVGDLLEARLLFK